jgi:hypothetical protein
VTVNLSALSRRLILLLGVLTFGNACGEPAPNVTVVDGPCEDVYGADICTWAMLEGERVVEVGARIPLASVENAPAEQEMVWPPPDVANIPLPEVAQERLGIHYVKINWEAHGHPPGPYLLPHFDFHFYVIPRVEGDAMDCSDLSKPTELPVGYDLPDVEVPGVGNLVGLCVEKMGMHALLESELAGEQPFSGTLVVGYYAGKPIFFEPMITRELLLRQETFPLEFPVIPGVDPGVTLPTQFEARYDESMSEYQFAFSGFPSD